MKKQKHQNKNKIHQPVLLDQVVEVLNPQKGESYLDLTAGYGGHAEKVIEITKSPERAVLVDRDQNAIDHLKELNLGAQLIKSDFLSYLRSATEKFDLVLMDLGVSSPHLDNAERGFSFMNDGPLDMRMDQSQDLSADTIVNTYGQKELADLIYEYGEERRSRKIAQLIVESRPIKTTNQLAEIVKAAYGPGYHKKHPATRTFQALRIAVNNELGQVESALPLINQLLNPGGRLAVISFHSLEDRIVKKYFKMESSSGYEATLKTVNGAIRGATEDVNNPRSRSAILRGVVKINTQN